MYKVIVERPRRGGGHSKGRRDDFEVAERESIRRRHTNRKSLNENLAPLKRFLRSRVGRPWNKVYSEICENIKVANTVQKHVRDHIPDFVAFHVKLVGKVPHFKTSSRYGSTGPIWHPFYVHPETGILCASPPKRLRKYKPVKQFEQIPIDRLHKWVKVEDIWYWVEFREMPNFRLDALAMYRDDHILKIRIDDWKVSQEWGANIYAVSKRQANKKEIRGLAS